MLKNFTTQSKIENKPFVHRHCESISEKPILPVSINYEIGKFVI